MGIAPTSSTSRTALDSLSHSISSAAMAKKAAENKIARGDSLRAVEVDVVEGVVSVRGLDQRPA